jgi:hypothetical protein
MMIGMMMRVVVVIDSGKAHKVTLVSSVVTHLYPTGAVDVKRCPTNFSLSLWLDAGRQAEVCRTIESAANSISIRAKVNFETDSEAVLFVEDCLTFASGE